MHTPWVAAPCSRHLNWQAAFTVRVIYAFAVIAGSMFACHADQVCFSDDAANPSLRKLLRAREKAYIVAVAALCKRAEIRISYRNLQALGETSSCTASVHVFSRSQLVQAWSEHAASSLSVKCYSYNQDIWVPLSLIS